MTQMNITKDWTERFDELMRFHISFTFIFQKHHFITALMRLNLIKLKGCSKCFENNLISLSNKMKVYAVLQVSSILTVHS